MRVILTFLVVCLLWGTAPAEEKEARVKRITLAGLRETIKDNRGKILIIDFWATYCIPCREAMPFLDGLYKAYRDKGLEVIGISVEGEGEEVIGPFVEMLNLTYPIFIGGDDIIEAYDIQYVPVTYILGKDSKVRMKEIGFDRQSPSKLKSKVEELLRGD